MDEILQILREEEATLNLPIKTRMAGINEAFYSSHREEKLCDNIWILDSGASCHMAKESVWFKNISPEVMHIYLADKNSKMMSQGTGNVSAKTVSTKHCNSINLTITDVSYVPHLRCNLLSVTCLMDKGCEIENETWGIDSFFEVTPERNEINQNTENGVLYNFDINNGPGAIENDNSIPLQTMSSPRTGRIQIPVLELNDVQNQIPVRRSERLKSKLMSVHLVNNVPNSYFEAENSANWKNWKLAMENELDSLDKHKVWEIVQKPAKSKLIKTKWVYSLKQDDAGKNIKYKARLVAAGFNQIKNIDYSESYSPVVNIESFRLLIVLAAKSKLNVNFFDVKTAYLYGDLEETVYVLPPPGYEKLIGDDKICKLKKSIYGLPQSGRNWYMKIKGELENFGLKQLASDNCVFIKSVNQSVLILCMYVDNLAIFCNNDKMYEDIVTNRTRPDISFVMSYLSQFNHNPEKRHYNLAKRVLRYLMGSKDKKLFYENEFGILNASSDASWEMQKMENHFLEV
ncbi:retrovirus-related Pol polyprotein from transposon TNT 1-94 [Trichonephila clavipes]|nr:retrovirus-related Pol polyprotein from transposon TNT 1-94 [Trichonephila clavipes]